MMIAKIAQPSAPPASAATYARPNLPTFPLEAGYREIYDPETGEYRQMPLTLLDILYPTEEDIGVVVMPESPLHDIWRNLLTMMLRGYLAGRNWLILSDVLIHWGRPGAPPKGPDLAAIPGGRLPPTEEKSYRVGRDGPLPAFVAELTSVETRQIDLQEKPLLYAAVGVKEFLIIDLLPKRGREWRLKGYRLEAGPFYRELQPDAEGGLSFETLGLRFVGGGRVGVELYDLTTKERLLTPDELRTRMEAEAAARTAAEARAAELTIRLRELEARYGLQPEEPATQPGPEEH